MHLLLVFIGGLMCGCGGVALLCGHAWAPAAIFVILVVVGLLLIATAFAVM